MKKWILPALGSLLLASCGGPKEADTVMLEEIEVVEPLVAQRPVYQAEVTKEFDLIHTKLDLKFDWENQHVIGRAWLDVKPWFYTTDHFKVEAKGFDLFKVQLAEDSAMTDLSYSYDSLVIDINLGKEFTREDTLTIYIEYVAKPNELNRIGSAAIAGAKGLYFIDPLDEDPKKRSQIWTQGETESNSCWFPTLDKPNQKMTQEIFLTVNSEYRTLSNGLLVYSVENNDGTRLDYWKQDIPHAPYLVMLGIGPFEKVDDEWRDLEVSYYVEEEYEPYARTIFGETPDMIEFYSELLGVDFPWDKYSQIIVRDYVSGAMENTSATIHGDFVYQDDRTVLDRPQHDIIAHELFHQWFGDLVTCESWSNLPLNESFATYGEYLWREHAYGVESADYHNWGDLKSYLSEFERGKQVDMIRFDYNDKEAMFDSHSYAKGGRILHMLRNYLGDEAFFEGLGTYLLDNAFQPAEIHDLRLAMEKVTGQDLNWFFNQWFLASGHPQLEVEYAYSDSTGEQIVRVKQTQDLEKTPLYYLPVAIDLHYADQMLRHDVIIDEGEEEFRFKSASRPVLVNFDGDRMLLAQVSDNRSTEDFQALYVHGNKLMDRIDAQAALLASGDTAVVTETVLASLDDAHPYLRIQALRGLSNADSTKVASLKPVVKEMAYGDERSSVRTAAVETMANLYAETDEAFYMNRLRDDSYSVNAASLRGLAGHDAESALNQARKLGPEAKTDLVSACMRVIADHGDKNDAEFMKTQAAEASGFGAISLRGFYADYLARQEEGVVADGYPTLTNAARTASPWYLRYTAMSNLEELRDGLKERSEEEGAPEWLASMVERLSVEMAEIKEAETNATLKSYWGR